jgi:hypothetical protein
MHIKCKLEHKYTWNVNSYEMKMHEDIYQSNNYIHPLVASQERELPQTLDFIFNSKS